MPVGRLERLAGGQLLVLPLQDEPRGDGEHGHQEAVRRRGGAAREISGAFRGGIPLSFKKGHSQQLAFEVFFKAMILRY